MSYFGLRFDNVKGNESKELIDLYRVRDKDPEWVDYFSKFAINHRNTKDDHGSVFITKNFNQPYDPLYESMTESERIESGRPTQLLKLTFSKPFMFFMTLWLNIGIYQYSKIYIPGGVVLQAQRKESLYQYLA